MRQAQTPEQLPLHHNKSLSKEKMTIYNHRKKIIFFASIAFVALIGFSMFATVVLADSPPAQPAQPVISASGTGFLESLKDAFAGPAMAIVGGIFLIIERIILYLFQLVSDYFQIALAYNFLNPSNLAVATYGWGISRDFANAFLILLLLWVAFTIIFNLERLGGKEFLVRIIAVGLTINFSLALVTAVFGFSNVLANVFQQNLPPNIGTFVISTIQLQTIFKLPSQDEINKVIQAGTPAANPPPSAGAGVKTTELLPGTNNGNTTGLAIKSTIKDIANASIGTNHAEAGTLGVINTTVCGLGLTAGIASNLLAPGIGTTALGLAYPFLGSVCGSLLTFTGLGYLFGTITGAGTGFESAFSQAVALAIIDIFLFMITAAMFYAALALIIRFLAQILLTIAAPIAFLLYAVPSKNLASYSELWMNNLLKWAFFAPAFYFLLYMSLYILQQYNTLALAEQNTQPLLVAGLDVNRTMEIVIISILFYITVRFSKQAAGEFGKVVVNWGKRAGKFAAMTVGLGALQRAGRGLRTATATTAEKIAKSERLATGPLRYIPGAKTVQRNAARIAAGQREAIAAAEKQYSRYTADELGRMLPGEFRPTYRAAILKQLGDKKGIDKLPDAQAETEIMRLKNLGEDVKPLLKQKPSLAKLNPTLVSLTPGEQSEVESLVRSGATQEEAARKVAFRSVIKSIKPADIKNLSNKTFDDEEFIKEAWINWSPEHLSALYRDNPRLFDEKMNNTAMIREAVNEMSVESYKRYEKYMLNNPLGQTMGISLPPRPTAATPAAVRPTTLTASPGRFVGTATSGANWSADINISGGAPYYSAKVKSGYTLPRSLAVKPRGNTVRVEGLIQEPAGSIHNFVIEIQDTGGNTIDVPVVLTVT